jgi:RNA polymerase sigma-70 factor (ECF subfamily)
LCLVKEGEVRHGIYLTHRSALVEYATPILGSREAAEDIVQDAFIRFTPAAARIASPEQALAYLYRIVRNLAFDVIKRRKVEKRETDGDAPFWAVPRAEPTPEQSLLFCDQIRIVADTLSGLPIETRVAVEMYRFGGFTLEEVADHLGISVATAHRHVRSAMLKVAARLDRGDC